MENTDEIHIEYIIEPSIINKDFTQQELIQQDIHQDQSNQNDSDQHQSNNQIQYTLDSCPICFNTPDNIDFVLLQLKCGHFICENCFVDWHIKQSKHKCSICRIQIKDFRVYKSPKSQNNDGFVSQSPSIISQFPNIVSPTSPDNIDWIFDSEILDDAQNDRNINFRPRQSSRITRDFNNNNNNNNNNTRRHIGPIEKNIGFIYISILTLLFISFIFLIAFNKPMIAILLIFSFLLIIVIVYIPYMFSAIGICCCFNNNRQQRHLQHSQAGSLTIHRNQLPIFRIEQPQISNDESL